MVSIFETVLLKKVFVNLILFTYLLGENCIRCDYIITHRSKVVKEGGQEGYCAEFEVGSGIG